MKKSFAFILLLLTSYSWSTDTQTVRSIVKIQRDQAETRVLSYDQGNQIPIIITDEKVKDLFAALPDGSEAVVEGHITYEVISGDASKSLTPFFVIQSIHPVSLSKLGAGTPFNTPIPELQLNMSTPMYAPAAIPVTTEVASAITLTTSMMLMESLSAQGDPEGRRELRKAVFISAGTMATLLFIYDQMTGKTKP